MCISQCVLTISVQVISLISPASGLCRVAWGRVAATTVLCQEVSQSKGLPLLVLLLSWRANEQTHKEEMCKTVSQLIIWMDAKEKEKPYPYPHP